MQLSVINESLKSLGISKFCNFFALRLVIRISYALGAGSKMSVGRRSIFFFFLETPIQRNMPNFSSAFFKDIST